MRHRTAARRQGGFTLIELLVVVIIIGILAAVAIPMFVGHRRHAYDANAQSLVREAASTIEAAAVNGDYAGLTPAAVQAEEQSIRFDAANNAAKNDEVAVAFDVNGYTVSSLSQSGKTFTLTKDLSQTPPVTRTCGAGCTW